MNERERVADSQTNKQTEINRKKMKKEQEKYMGSCIFVICLCHCKMHFKNALLRINHYYTIAQIKTYNHHFREKERERESEREIGRD